MILAGFGKKKSRNIYVNIKTNDMKNRLLPFSLIPVFAGLFFLIFSVLLMAGQPGNPDLGKFKGSRWESVRANQYTGVVNPQDVVNARLQFEALQTKATAGAMNLNWISAGPDNYPGLVWSCIFDNTDPSCVTLIAGAATGGIWKSINLGLTWSQMAVENNIVPKVSSLVQAANGTIYAATGVTTCKSIKFNGNGIYVSQNGSAFAVIPATQNNPDFNGVTKLAISLPVVFLLPPAEVCISATMEQTGPKPNQVMPWMFVSDQMVPLLLQLVILVTWLLPATWMVGLPLQQDKPIPCQTVVSAGWFLQLRLPM